MINIDYILRTHGISVALWRDREAIAAQKMVVMPSFAFTTSLDSGGYTLGDPTQQLYLLLGADDLDIEIEDEFEHYPTRANLNNVMVINVDRTFKQFGHIQALGRILT